MASNNNFSGMKFAVIAVAVVGLSGIIGYFLAGNGRPSSPVSAPVQVAQSTPDTSAPQTGDGSASDTLAAHGGDFTAPGAPKIEIREVKPHLQDDTRVSKSAPKTQDSEASQEDAPPAPSDATPPTDDATTEQPSPVTGQTTTPASTDPDYENVGGNNPDTTATSPNTDDDNTPSGSGGPYRVQVGSFAYARNAKALADALHSRGYTTSTVMAKDGDKTTYHVQTGAFRSQKAAQKASDDLQKAGFPAFIQQ